MSCHTPRLLPFISQVSFFILCLGVCCVSLSACSEPELPEVQVEEEIRVETAATTQANSGIPHSYGGWFCPDNLRGFPPVNIKDLHEVPVVNGRMPTKEETQDGTSLMYFDPQEHPNAKPLDITLPRLARYSCEQSGKNELVIVIQAVVADQDTVVGFRFVNGGNGSSWFNEVNFLEDEEIAGITITSFASIEGTINASKEKIWEVIKNPANEAILSKIYTDGIPRDGLTNTESMELFGNFYIQMDYDFGSEHYVEKILLMNGAYDGISHMQLVAGPNKETLGMTQLFWDQWFEKVKELSEIG